jgi:hypothetical protein
MPAAFLGMLLELESYEPVFAEPGERAEDALTRVRPVLGIFLHSELDAARSDLFFARATRTGARVVLFGTPPSSTDARALASERGVPYFEMPVDRAALASVVSSIARDAGRARSTVDRRAPRAYDAPDGTLLFSDESGRVWRVYDRRGTVRRARPTNGEDASYRVFINESGEERRYQPQPRESLETSVDALARQLSEATKPAAGED